MIPSGFTDLTLQVLRNENFQRVKTKQKTKPNHTPKGCIPGSTTKRVRAWDCFRWADASAGYHSTIGFSIYYP